MRTKEEEPNLNETWSPSCAEKVKASYDITACVFLGETQ